jgi:hypothetical protein
MFTLANWQNPETLMLNITNALMGLFVVFVIGRIVGHVIHDAVLLASSKHKAKH